MSRKTWLLSACGALLIGGLAANAGATAASIDIILKSVDGVPVPGAAQAVGAKTWEISHVGQKFHFEGWLNLPSGDANFNEGYYLFLGSVLSYKAMEGGAPVDPAAVGRFTPAGMQQTVLINRVPVTKTQWWTTQKLAGAKSSTDYFQNIIPTEQNLSFTTPGFVKAYGPMFDDGSLDMGEMPVTGTSLGGALSFRADPALGDVPPASDDLFTYGMTAEGAPWVKSSNDPGYKVGLFAFDWTVESFTQQPGKTNKTLVNWAPLWKADTDNIHYDAAKYFTDGVDMSGALDTNGKPLFGVSEPVVLFTVPEPASFSILALGALGLLARRRK